MTASPEALTDTFIVPCALPFDGRTGQRTHERVDFLYELHIELDRDETGPTWEARSQERGRWIPCVAGQVLAWTPPEHVERLRDWVAAHIDVVRNGETTRDARLTFGEAPNVTAAARAAERIARIGQRLALLAEVHDLAVLAIERRETDAPVVEDIEF